jgi:hypothetical protein
MSKNKIIFFLIFLAAISCRRNEERSMVTTAKGKVLDKETMEPIGGATVFFLKIDQSNPSVGIPYTSVTCDSLGNYTFTFTAETNFSYAMYPDNGNYLDNGLKYLLVGSTNNYNLLLSKPGYMAIHVKNTSPIDSTDEINVFNSDYHQPDHIFAGSAVDTTIVIRHYGNQTNLVHWKITKNDTTITYNQSFNFISLDTLAFDLFY